MFRLSRLALLPFAVCLPLLFGLGPALADDVPFVINFQGRLVDDAGKALPGPVKLSVSIWDALTSEPFDDPLFAEDHPAVEVRDGIFSIGIGSGTPVFGAFDGDTFQDGDRYLEIAIDDGDPLEPRLPFNSVAYSLRTQPAGPLIYQITAAGCDPAIYPRNSLTLAPVCLTPAVPCNPSVPLYRLCDNTCSFSVGPIPCQNEAIGFLIAP